MFKTLAYQPETEIESQPKETILPSKLDFNKTQRSENNPKQKPKKKGCAQRCIGYDSFTKCNPIWWLILIPIVLILLVAFLGPWYHQCDKDDNCYYPRRYGIYCDNYCVYGHYGPGATSGLLLFFLFFLLIFCFFGAFSPECDSTYDYSYPYGSLYRTDNRPRYLTVKLVKSKD